MVKPFCELLGWVMWREERRKQGRQRDQHDEHRAQHGDPVAAQTTPGLREIAVAASQALSTDLYQSLLLQCVH